MAGNLGHASGAYKLVGGSGRRAIRDGLRCVGGHTLFGEAGRAAPRGFASRRYPGDKSGGQALHGSMWIAGERLETNAVAPLRRP
jgi:hypothetical protein